MIPIPLSLQLPLKYVLLFSSAICLILNHLIFSATAFLVRNRYQKINAESSSNFSPPTFPKMTYLERIGLILLFFGLLGEIARILKWYLREPTVDEMKTDLICCSHGDNFSTCRRCPGFAKWAVYTLLHLTAVAYFWHIRRDLGPVYDFYLLSKILISHLVMLTLTVQAHRWNFRFCYNRTSFRYLIVAEKVLLWLTALGTLAFYINMTLRFNMLYAIDLLVPTLHFLVIATNIKLRRYFSNDDPRIHSQV